MIGNTIILSCPSKFMMPFDTLPTPEDWRSVRLRNIWSDLVFWDCSKMIPSEGEKILWICSGFFHMRYYASTNVSPLGETKAIKNAGFSDLIHWFAGDNTNNMTFRTSPDRFAKDFNEVVPGAYRQITTQDVRDMTDCGLIGRYNCYPRSDLETVRAILQYEQLRQRRIEKPQPSAIPYIRKCKICGKALSIKQCLKHGRKKEFCPNCESLRIGMRYRKWREIHQIKTYSKVSTQLKAP